MPSKATCVATTALAALIAASAGLIAGPLAPPAGPVNSTYKTLTEVREGGLLTSRPMNASCIHI